MASGLGIITSFAIISSTETQETLLTTESTAQGNLKVDIQEAKPQQQKPTT